MWLLWLVRAVLVAMSAAACYTDIRWRRIPHGLTWPAAALGVAALTYRAGWLGLAMSGAGIGVMVLVTGVPWILGGYGGGDFFFGVAAGAIGGPLFAVEVLFWSIATGVLLWGGWIAARGWKTAVADPPPYAPALAAGVLGALWFTLR